MRFDRASIFWKLNLLFVIAVVAISMVFLIFGKVSRKRAEQNVLRDGVHLVRLMRELRPLGKDGMNRALQEEGYSMVENPGAVLAHARVFRLSGHLPPPIRRRYENRRLEILESDGRIYYLFHLPKKALLIASERQYGDMFRLFVAYAGIVSVLLFLYLGLRRSLLPLKTLQKQIESYGKGARHLSTRSEKRDEIASLANAFDDTMRRINALEQTRTLFLRNMMHELKTPLTKGKLTLSLMPQSDDTHLLEEILGRMQNLVEEMADIEALTTQNVTLSFRQHRLVDIIDNSVELLYLDAERIEHDVGLRILRCDFSLFTIAVKNLIDNAVKYGSDRRVMIVSDADSISFISRGNALQRPFESYLQPFSKGEPSVRNREGFGLGLYIVSEILKLHGFGFQYRHEEGKNRFVIQTG